MSIRSGSGVSDRMSGDDKTAPFHPHPIVPSHPSLLRTDSKGEKDRGWTSRSPPHFVPCSPGSPSENGKAARIQLSLQRQPPFAAQLKPTRLDMSVARWTVCSAPPGLFPALFVPIRRPCLVVGLATFVMDDDGGFADGMIGGDWGGRFLH